LQLLKYNLSRLGVARRALALAVVFSFLLSMLLASAPALHARWHGDAGQPNHECAATLLSHQNVTPADPVVLIQAGGKVWLPLVAVTPAEIISSFASTLPPERGPPSLPC